MRKQHKVTRGASNGKRDVRCSSGSSKAPCPPRGRQRRAAELAARPLAAAPLLGPDLKRGPVLLGQAVPQLHGRALHKSALAIYTGEAHTVLIKVLEWLEMKKIHICCRRLPGINMFQHTF